MKKIQRTISATGILLIFLLNVCASNKGMGQDFELNAKPYARYWWFASKMQEEDIRYNLDWLKENGFGGVELAWLSTWNSRANPQDTQVIRPVRNGLLRNGRVLLIIPYAMPIL